MPITFRCQNCGREKPRNYRLTEQKYCADVECQQARRREYQKNRLQADALYRHQQVDCRRAWHIKRSLAGYQRAYRASHPDYVRNNRQQQRWRNPQRRSTAQTEPPRMIVKMNSCSSIESGIYLLTPCQVNHPSEVIVKMNSCMVELSVFQQDAPWPSRLAIDCK